MEKNTYLIRIMRKMQMIQIFHIWIVLNEQSDKKKLLYIWQH